jgi:cell division septation protein DedD
MPAPTPTVLYTSKLDTSQGNATAALYSAAIGPISVDYYLPVFTRFEALGRLCLAWNWAACLYTVNWMIFRGLWLAALVYAALVGGAVLLLFGLGRMIFQLSPGTELALLSTLLVLMFGVPGLLGNWLLYTAYRKKMAHALRESVTLPDACALLTRQASSRQRFLWLVSANTLAMAAALALYGWNTLQAGEPSSPPTPPVTQPTETAGLPTPAALPSPTQTGLVTYAEAPVAPVPPVLAASDAPPETATATQSRPAVEARPTPPARQRFYINVGLFAKDANAQNALDKLERAGLSTLSSTVSTSQGERTRVRAGPFNSEQEANAAAKTIRALNLDAVVMRQSP